MMEDVKVLSVKSPERVSNQHNFGITPFGVYCLDCSVPIGKPNDENVYDALKMHIGREKHSVPNGTTVVMLADSLKRAIVDRFGHVQNYNSWLTQTNIQTYQCTCGTKFANTWNLQRHAKRAEKNNPESTHRLIITKSVRSVCGRVIEDSKITEMMKEPIRFVADDDTNSNDYIPIQAKNKNTFTMQLDKVKNIFGSYKRPNESLEPYLASLKLVTINENGPVIERIKNCLSLVDNDRSKIGTL